MMRSIARKTTTAPRSAKAAPSHERRRSMRGWLQSYHRSSSSARYSWTPHGAPAEVVEALFLACER